MDPLYLVAIAVGAQLPLLGVAILLEFSRRKARRAVATQAPHDPQALRPVPIPTATPPSVEPEAPPTGPPGEAPPLTAEQPPPIPETGREPIEVVPQRERQAELPPVSAPQPPSVADQALPPDVSLPAPIEVPPASREVGQPTPSLREPLRLGRGLRRTRENFLARIRSAITGSAKLDEVYEGLEEALIAADVGVETSLAIIEAVRNRLKNDARTEVIRDALKDEIERILVAAERPFADSGDAPTVVLMTGVNGVGKTTTVAKLAAMFKADNHTVLVAAADTFRAAAIDQLQVWCDRVGVDLIKQNQGSDPAAVAFDAVKAAVARKADAVLIDTAGRLQTKVNLMEELKKIARVVGRELPGAPHETWLVLDANTGQNALSQAKIFGDATGLTGVVLAKLDSTAKGGVIIAIAERLKLPVRYVGLGEGIEDLRRFDSREFVNALFSDSEEGREAASGIYAA